MGDVKNLRLARKRKEQAEREKSAAANRAKFGRPKHEREIAEARAIDAAKKLEGHRRSIDRDEE